MQIKSNAFENNRNIPSKYTADGQDINPDLEISEIPSEAKTIVLIVDDPDAPAGTWTHWLVWNIQVSGNKAIIQEDSIPGIQGQNDFNKNNWGGPAPPSGEHRYFFRAYALSSELDLEEKASRQQLEQAMQGKILAQAELIGKYSRT
jgi:hypothetical protein